MTQKMFFERFIYWRDQLGLQNWMIGFKPADETTEKIFQKKNQTGMAVDIQSQYLQVIVYFDEKILEHEDHVIDECMLHELSHVLIVELKEWALVNAPELGRDDMMEYFEEKTVSQFARILCRFSKGFDKTQKSKSAQIKEALK